MDAKPGPNRRMGGFCTSVSDIEESRIFMTFSGTLGSAMTLAHELGHAYHNDILFQQPTSMRTITSSTAESASTFAEALFRDYMFEKAESNAIKIQIERLSFLAAAFPHFAMFPAPVCARARVYIYIYIHLPHTRTHAHTHTHTYARTRTRTRAHARTHARTHVGNHAFSHICGNSCSPERRH